LIWENVSSNPCSVRVAIDTTGLYTTQAGVARYIRGLLGGFKQMAKPPDFFELAWPVENFAYQQPQRALKTAYREFVWGPLLANAALRRGGASLLHTTFNVLYRPCLPYVATLHDLALLRHPERFRKWQVASARHRLGMIARADRIICISLFTADEAMALLDVPASKIQIVYNGVDFHDSVAAREQRPDVPVPPDFFLFVGSLEPGKNLSLLKETYQLARSSGRMLPPLVIVGARWSGVADEGPPPADWYYLGRQPDEAVVYLYRRARALLFPSKYEGFGLPVAEAQTLGCPVICSRIASIPEVAGSAAIYSELTAAGYLEAMSRLVGDTGLRDELIRLGRIQAAHFSWSRCAQETAAIYEDAAA
jgi:glycosyltransferase involved in cell wall biosynthesis